mmetsp:Transcript_23086/g.60765  ORF Transcript_23086/g.60765 Transcript_23086/m.60765 type:complete len:606 (+) Transcript_23086:257-2074(+)
MRSPTKCPPCMCVCVFALSACKSSYPASQGTCRAEHTRALLRSPRVRKARSERGSAHAHSRTPVVKQVQAPQGAAVAYVSCPRAARGHHRRAPDPSSSPHRRSRSPPHTPTCAPAAPRVLTSVVCSRARAARSRQTLVLLRPGFYTSILWGASRVHHGALHGLGGGGLEHRRHLIEVGVVKDGGQAHVDGAGDDARRHGELLFGLCGRVLPVAEVARVVLGAEEADGHAAPLAVGEEGLHLLGREVDEVELERVADGAHTRVEGRHVDVRRLRHRRHDALVPLVVLGDALLEVVDLGADARRRQVRHAQRIVRRLELDALEDLRRGRDDVLRVQQLVAAGIADGARGDLVVVGAEEAALTRVDHLGSLRGEARDIGGAAGLDAVPLDAEGVRAVLHHLQVELLRDLVHSLHVGELAAHVCEHQVLGVGRDALAHVVRVDHVRLRALDVLGHGAGVVDRRGHGGEREGVGEHRLTRLHAEALQGNEERRAARVEADAVLEAGVLGEGGLGQRDLGEHAGLVPEQRARAHQLQRALAASLRDRVGARQRLVEGGALHPPPPPHPPPRGTHLFVCGRLGRADVGVMRAGRRVDRGWRSDCKSRLFLFL